MEDWALGVEGGRVMGTIRRSSGSTWVDRLDKVEDVQKERDSSDVLLGPTKSSVDGQHGTTFCAFAHARASSDHPFKWTAGFRRIYLGSA